jgi:hypothetical protein
MAENNNPEPRFTPVGPTEKTVDVITGHTPIRDFMSTFGEDGTATAEEAKAKTETKEAPPVQTEKSTQKMILGKFKEYGELEKAYKELEKQYHGDERIKKFQDERKALRDQLDSKERELSMLKSGISLDREITETDLNAAIAENPAKALLEFEQYKQAKAAHEEAEKSRISMENRMREDIQANIDFMRREYPEFQTQEKDIADWARNYDMDTGKIFSDRNLMQDFYRDFVDAHTDWEKFADANAREGATRAREKEALQPPSAGNGSQPHPLKAAAPAKQAESEIDPLQAMEMRMRIGSHWGDDMLTK